MELKSGQKVCVITGGNSGIGKQSAIQLAHKGYYVIIGCRDEYRGLQAVSDIVMASGSEDVEFIKLDLSLKASTLKFVSCITGKFACIDILISNAATFDISVKRAEMTFEGHENVWMTNHVNASMLVENLIPALQKSGAGRVLFVSSMGLMAKPIMTVNLTDPEYKARKFNMPNAYYQSKFAQLAMTKYLAKEVGGRGVTVNAVRVPIVKLDMDRFPNVSKCLKAFYKIKTAFAIPPEKMAEAYTFLVTDAAIAGCNGVYFNDKCKSVKFPKKLTAEHIEEVVALTRSYYN